jgi:chromosome segregation ATPase
VPGGSKSLNSQLNQLTEQDSNMPKASAAHAPSIDAILAEREACVRATQVDVDALRKIAESKQQLVDEDYPSDRYQQAYKNRERDPDALRAADKEHERLVNEASTARSDANKAASRKERAQTRIADIDEMLGAKAARQVAKSEYSEHLETIAAKQVRRAALRNTTRDLRSEISRCDEQGKLDVEAALERDVEARIAGGSTPVANELQSFENAQSVRRASLAKAERMLSAADEEIKELHQRLKQIAKRYFVARRNMLRLHYSTMMAEIAPVAIELAAACRLADVSPDEPTPLNHDDVERAATAIAAELPSLPRERVVDLPQTAERSTADGADAPAQAAA